MPLPPQLLGSITEIYYTLDTAAFLLTEGNPQPWRPPQWANGTQLSLTLTATDPNTQRTTVYVFDAIIRNVHDRDTVITLNPVQTGAALSDHAYVVPPRVTTEIMMSDSMQSFITGQWADGPSRSVSAYQTLVGIQEQKLGLSLATRYWQYDNMMITNIRAEEKKDTLYAGKFSVTFQQILLASVEVTNSTISFGSMPAVSSIPQATGQTLTGLTQTQTIPAAIKSQDALAPITIPNSTFNLGNYVAPAISGSGYWTSTGLGNLTKVLTAVGV